MDEEEKRQAEELLFSKDQLPSFAKILFFGTLDHKRTFPFPKVDKEEQERTDSLIERLNTFCDEHLDPAWIDKNCEIPQKIIQGLADLGILGLSVPKEYGGSAASQYAYSRVIDSLSRRCGSTTLFINVQQSIGMQAFLQVGTDKQKEEWIPQLIKAQKLAAFSLTEPNAGSDANGVETRAVYDPEKKAYILNGRKQWTTNGGIADVLTLMARTEVQTKRGIEDKITAFIVTPKMKGFKVLDVALEKVGMRGTKTANLALENVEVPEENVLGKPGEGLKLALSVLNYGRITFGAACTGAAKELFERALLQSCQRYQFKRPIGSFDLVKKKLAIMAGKVYAMDAMTQLTAGLMDKGQNDVMLEASILKVFTSDCLWDILYDTMQIFGGRCFFSDQPFERMMRDARLNMIGEGANEVLRAFIGAVGMRDVGMQLKEFADSLKSPFSSASIFFKHGKSMLRYLKQPQVPIKSPHIASEAKEFGKLIQSFGRAIPRLLAKYKEEVVEQQLALDRIATCAMSLYALTATLSKLDSEIVDQCKPANELQKDISVVKLFCKEQFNLIRHNLSTLFNNHDSMIKAVADQLTGIKYP